MQRVQKRNNKDHKHKEDNTRAKAKETAATDGTNKIEGKQVQESPTKTNTVILIPNRY